MEFNSSDAVRRASLKKQKEAFKEKELLIRNALKSVDGNTNKKIIFDDNIGEEDDSISTTNISKKRQLFHDDDAEERDSTEAEFNFNEEKAHKVINLGNDPRFAMDQRFLEKEEPPLPEENDNDEDEMTNEKNQQLEILEHVLGKPLAKRKEKQVAVKRKHEMIRYDPTQDAHQMHELQKEESRGSKNKKRKVNKAKVEDKEPIPVSTEIFYSVSENLAKAIEAPGEFSLLRRFGTAPAEKPTNTNEDKQSTEKKSSSKYNFDCTNTDRYDSSEGEEEMPVENAEKEVVDKNFMDVQGTFFVNEAVFREAVQFFKAPASSNQSFRHLRRELKEIVRTKIRRNIRKTQIWKRHKINKMKPSRK